MTPEAKVKKYLREQCKARGWLCLPLVHHGLRGWPDNTILGPGGRVAFVEVKAEEVHHSKDHLERQEKVREKLRQLGHFAFLVKGKIQVDGLMSVLTHGRGWPVKI